MSDLESKPNYSKRLMVETPGELSATSPTARFRALLIARRAWWGPLLVIVISGALQATPGAVELLSFQRAAIDSGQFWRLWTGNFVHLSYVHWALNACGLLLLPLLCDESARLSAWIMLVIWLATAVGFGLYWNTPSVVGYVGLSGILYGLFSFGFLRQIWRGDWIAAVCLLGLVGRVVWGLLGNSSLSEERMIGGHVIAQSHLYGMGIAIVSALFLKAATQVARTRKTHL